jgi:hypothetical protein
MQGLYVYLILLLILLLFTVYALIAALKYAPKKIKILSVGILMLILLKNLSLLIFFLAQKIFYLYYLKSFLFLNMVCFPILAIICIFIFIRNNKINFSYFFIVAVVLLCLYIIIINASKPVIRSLNSYGYTVELLNGMYLNYGFIALSSLIILVCIHQIGREGVNNIGIFYTLICSSVSLTDVVLIMLGINYLNHNIVGEVLYILTFNYALRRLKN